MRTRSLLSWSSAVVTLLALVIAARSAEFEKESFQVASGDRFSVQHPSGWKTESNPADGTSTGTFRLVDSESASILLISAIPSKPGANLDSMDDLESLLILGTKPMVRDSVEKKLCPLSFKSDHSYGVYVALTDGRFMPPAVPPKGEYLHTATFILNCSHRAVVATFLTNQERSASIDLSIMILKTLLLEDEHK